MGFTSTSNGKRYLFGGFGYSDVNGGDQYVFIEYEYSTGLSLEHLFLCLLSDSLTT